MGLTFALILDALFGEPDWIWSRLPHPAVVMGRLIAWCDSRFNQPRAARGRGILVMAALFLGAAGLGLVLAALPGIWAEVIVGAILLAQKSLTQHVTAVANGLDQSAGAGRAAVAMIVGRDTAQMTAPDVARGAIESAAENFSDGVMAPFFWFAIAGLPGALAYKITNTADSMIGYRTPRHAEFGWAAARLDDLLNLVPARLSALLIAATTGQLGQWRAIAADARGHRSPNAGWPEAAMARAVGISLAGPRSYHGQVQAFPYVNAAGRKDARAQDIRRACAILWRSWWVILAFSVLVWLV